MDTKDLKQNTAEDRPKVYDHLTAKKFIGALRKPDEQFSIVIIPDKKETGVYPQTLETTLADYDSISGTIEKYNAAGMGVSVVINYGGTKAGDITDVRALFIDIDDKPFDEQKALIKVFPLRPSLVVMTRRSYHAYWKVEGISAAEFGGYQKALVRHFGADGACVNVNRAMRVPGSFHCKGEPVQVQLVCYHPERVYTKADLDGILAPAPTEEHPSTYTGERTLSTNVEAMLYGCDFLRLCKANAATLSEPLWQAMIANLSCFEGGTELIHTYSSPYPGYSKEETDRKTEHFLRSASGPITCDVIRDRGFVCPRKAAGECSCKAPAAIIYDLENVKTVEAICANYEFTGDKLKDIVLCEKIISEQFGEVSLAQGKVLITTTLKNAAKLNADEVSELKRFFKELRSKPVVPDTEDGLKYYRTEGKRLVFQPDLLANDLVKQIPLMYLTEKFYVYDGGVYKPVSRNIIRAEIRKRMLAGYIKMPDINDALAQTASIREADGDEVMGCKNIINLKNGLYDIKNKDLKEHTPDFKSVVQLPVSYVPDAECPHFMGLLRYALPEDQVLLLQEIMGYLLIPETKAQKAFVLYGATRAGKSVILRVIRELIIGKENTSTVAWQSLSSKFSSAELFGKMVNVFADLPTSSIEDNSTFLSCVGEDSIQAERKFKDPFSMSCTARMIFSCNSLPRNLNNRSDAFYERLILIHFTKTVPEEERDKNLFEKLKAEADGIFLFALRGLERLIENNFNFTVTAENNSNIEQYKAESSPVILFMQENVEFDEHGKVFARELYDRYKVYCNECEYKPLSKNNFVATMENRLGKGHRKKDPTTRRWCWFGIRLTSENE